MALPSRRTVMTTLTSFALSGGVHADSAPIVVSSKLDVEGGILGAMILLALQDAGIPTTDRLLLGPTTILRQAILGGAIDIYPEYTGNAAFFFHEDGAPVWRDAAAGYRRAASLDAARNDLVWLKPAPADNNWVIAVPRRTAEQENLRTLDAFASAIRGGKTVKLAASAEFVESAAGLPAFESAYGFNLSAAQMLVLSGGETSATIKATADGISGVTCGMAYGTDGALDALDLVVLEDTKRVQPVYAPAPVVRGAILQARPDVRAILDPVFTGLDLSTLRRLNARVAVEGYGAADVARDYLQTRRPAHP
jgi:osmoprotectant transport system substrate-binding protein